MAQKNKWWCFEVYQEHWNDEVVAYLENTHLEIVAALHDKDVTEKGEPKKPHYHVLVKYGNTTTLNCIEDIFGSIAANGVVFPVTSPRGMYRYLRHLDNPEKHQYGDDVYIYFNGFDATDVLNDTDFEIIMSEIDEKIVDDKIIYYHELVEYFLKEGMPVHVKAIHKHSNHFKNMLSSVKLKTDTKAKRKEEIAKQAKMLIGEKKKMQLSFLPTAEDIEQWQKDNMSADDIVRCIRERVIKADEIFADNVA